MDGEGGTTELLDDDMPDDDIEPTPPKEKPAPIDEDPTELSHNTARQMDDLHGPDETKPNVPSIDDSIPKGQSEHRIGEDGPEPIEDDSVKSDQSRVKELSSSLTRSYDTLPTSSKSVISKNTPNVAFFSDPAKLTAELAKVSPEAAKRAASGDLYHGAIVPSTGQLLLAGSPSPDMTQDMHAYELSRAASDGRDASPEWKAAVDRDIASKTLSAYASDPQRAWGMFGVLVNRHQVSAEELACKFPAMTAVWQGMGLIPSSNKKPLVEPMELFRPDAAIYDQQANADSAYSPKESGLATFSRIGRNSMDWLKQNSEMVGDWAKKVLSSVPPSIRMPVVGMLRKTYYTYYLANQASMNIAQSRGMDPKKAKLLAAALSGADAILGGKVIPIAAGAACEGGHGLQSGGTGSISRNRIRSRRHRSLTSRS